MRILSLFSGAGGSCLGWHAAGAEHALCCEWDTSAGATLAAAGFPWSPTDLSDPGALRAALSPLAGSVDVLEASPPCQAWSSAGSRLGARDPRNGWPWTWHACDVVRPRWLVAENVPGLLSHRGECSTRSGGYPEPLDCPGCYWSEVILEEARRRFAWVGWWRLNAADYGVPQHRRRVFLVCGPRPAAPPTPTHADPATLRQRGLFGPGRLPWVTMREALQLGGSAEVIGGGTNASGDARSYRQIADEPSTTVAAVQIGNAGPWVVQHMQGAPRGLEAPAPALGGGGNVFLERPAPSVTAQEVKGTRASVASGWTFNGGPDRASDALFMATGRRRLTVEEVAALQDFPADHPWQGTKTSRYRQVGNAVPPRLAEVVARAVMGVDDGL
jgi:DNA (cytosine-5)-methyltransferase 1